MRIALILGAALLLAGCIDGDLPNNGEGSGIQPGEGVTPPENLQEATNGNIHFSGTVEACDAGFCLDATVSNEGSERVYVSDDCVPPFSESMEQGDSKLNHKEPRFYCQTFSLGPFEGGANMDYDSTWDGRIWNDGYSDAEPGDYTWIVTFRYYESQQGDSHQDLVLKFPVSVE